MELDDKLRAFFEGTDTAIRERGWMVQGVFDPTAERPPYMYTVGLTEAGLPELAFDDIPVEPGEEQYVFAALGTRALNVLAKQSLAEALEVDRVYSVDLGDLGAAAVRVVVAPVEPTEAGIWPGLAFARYGRGRVRLLLVSAAE